MNELLKKEPVKRVEKSLEKFDPNLKIVTLDTITGVLGVLYNT